MALEFLRDRRTFVRRFVLAEVLGPPRGQTLRARRPGAPPPPPAPPPAQKAK